MILYHIIPYEIQYKNKIPYFKNFILKTDYIDMTIYTVIFLNINNYTSGIFIFDHKCTMICANDCKL